MTDSDSGYINVFYVTNRTRSDEDRETRPDDNYFTRNNVQVPPKGFYNKSHFDIEGSYPLENQEKRVKFESEQLKLSDDRGDQNSRVVDEPMDVDDTQELEDEDTDKSHASDISHATVKSERSKGDYEACLQSLGLWKFIIEHKFRKECEVCEHDFTTKSMFMLHPSCYRHRLINKHIKSGVTDRGKLYECLECDKRFKTRSALLAHSLNHYEPRFTCKLCPFTNSKCAQTAEKHEDIHLREYQVLFDGHVDKKVKQKAETIDDVVKTETVSNKGEHKHNDAKETPKSECSNSDDEESRKSDATPNSKLRFIEEYPFKMKCEECHEQFRSKSAFMIHPSCYNKRLKQKRIKNKTITGDESDDDGGLECLECDKPIRDMDYLRGHAYTHFEPRFRCTLCPFTANVLGNAIRHDGIHTTSKEEPSPSSINVMVTNVTRKKTILACSSNRVINPKTKLRFMTEYPFKKKCEICHEEFTSKSVFMVHLPCYHERLKNKHKKNNTFQEDQSDDDYDLECLECDTQIRDMVYLRGHANSHYEPRFKCTMCRFTCNSTDRAIKHDATHTGSKNTQSRQICSRSDPKIKGRRKRRTVFNYKFIREMKFQKTCNYCSNEFTTKPAFMIHDPCYEKRLKIKISNNNNHRKDGRYYCLECDKVYEERKILSFHVLNHYEPRFRCKLCDFTHNHRKDASIHDNEHQNEKSQQRYLGPKVTATCIKIKPASSNHVAPKVTEDRKRTPNPKTYKLKNCASKYKEPVQSTSKDVVGSGKSPVTSRVVPFRGNNNQKEYRVKFGSNQGSNKSQNKTSPPTERFRRRCVFCNIEFSSLPLFVLHTSCFNIKLARAGKKARVKSSDPWECIKCDKTFARRSGIMNHVMKNHKF